MVRLVLNETIKKLLVPGKGILAADESVGTIAKRFAKYKIKNEEEMREAYRELLFCTKGISDYISGVILYDETLRETDSRGKPLRELLQSQNIVVGCKVDEGLVAMSGSPLEMTTKGLEGLADRLSEYFDLGVRFAKWRAVFTVGKNLPSDLCIMKNAESFASYALLCQQSGIVPIVEPEVLSNGDHSDEQCFEATEKVLRGVFSVLEKRAVDLRFMLLKPNMIVPGAESRMKTTPERVANLTISCLKAVVPKNVPGIVFLSGGQSEAEACLNLNAIAEYKNMPWSITYSFGRALQNSALEAWEGDMAKAAIAQETFLHRAHLVSLSQQAKYDKSLEIK